MRFVWIEAVSTLALLRLLRCGMCGGDEMSSPTKPLLNETDHIMQFFSYRYLPPGLQKIARPFSDFAEFVVQMLPRNAERTVTLRKLLEARDAAMRASLAQ